MTRLLIGQGVVEWVAPRAEGQGFRFGSATAIGLERGGKIVAGVVYTNWNGRSIEAHIAIEGRLTPKFVWAICDYPFEQLMAQQVRAFIPQGNKASRRFAEKFGFVLETSFKDAHPSGDMLVHVLRRRECRWLKKPLALAA